MGTTCREPFGRRGVREFGYQQAETGKSPEAQVTVASFHFTTVLTRCG